MSPEMMHRGVPYTVVQGTAPGFWDWQFLIDDIVKTGRVRTNLELMAIRRVKTRIDRELREAARQGIRPAERPLVLRKDQSID